MTVTPLKKPRSSGGDVDDDKTCHMTTDRTTAARYMMWAAAGKPGEFYFKALCGVEARMRKECPDGCDPCVVCFELANVQHP